MFHWVYGIYVILICIAPSLQLERQADEGLSMRSYQAPADIDNVKKDISVWKVLHQAAILSKSSINKTQ